jgi:hypothetical protein
VLRRTLRPRASLRSQPELRARRFLPIFGPTMIAMNHRETLVASLIHDRRVVGAVLLCLGHKPRAQRMPGELRRGEPGFLATRLMMNATAKSVSRLSLSCSWQLIGRNTGPSPMPASVHHVALSGLDIDAPFIRVWGRTHRRVIASPEPLARWQGRDCGVNAVSRDRRSRGNAASLHNISYAK